jgi:hypothetical protein
VAKRIPDTSGHGSLGEATRQLEVAMATMIQTQATFMSQTAEYRRESAQRFARIEAQIAEIIRVLNEHGRILEGLPEAVREKVGLKATQ